MAHPSSLPHVEQLDLDAQQGRPLVAPETPDQHMKDIDSHSGSHDGHFHGQMELQPAHQLRSTPPHCPNSMALHPQVTPPPPIDISDLLKDLPPAEKVAKGLTNVIVPPPAFRVCKDIAKDQPHNVVCTVSFFVSAHWSSASYFPV